MNRRVKWIDKLKAISIMFVMLGHIDFCPADWSYFYAPFFLSAFLFASGYTFNSKRTFSEFLINKIKTLILPMFSFGLITISSRLLISFNDNHSIMKDLKDFIYQIRGKNDELWFIACIFGTSILFYFVIKLINSNRNFIIAIIILALISIVYQYIIAIPLPWHIQMYGIGCFYMGLGALYKKNEYKMKKNIRYLYFYIVTIVYVLVVYVQYLYKDHPPVTLYYFGDSLILYFITVLLGLMMIILFVNLIPDFRLLSFIGENSFIYYAFHGKIESLLLVVFKKLNLFLIVPNILLLLILYFIMEIIILIPITLFINKYFLFVLGKKYK